MKKILFSFLAIFLMTTNGCKEEILLPEMIQGEDGVSAIFGFDVLAPTDDHLNGGWSLDIGYDTNGNETLDDEEITASAPIWHGNDGINGTNGKDGLNGTDGIDGTNGVDGLNGTDGKDGVDGKTPNLYLVTLDLPKSEGHDNGGVLVTTVWDKDGNQLISEDEIVGAYTVWHGNNGADGSDGEDGEDGYDGKNGLNGNDGSDGQNGLDGHSPYILNEFWYYWDVELNIFVKGDKATGEDGIDGAKGDKGDTGERGTIVKYVVETALNCSTNGYRITMIIDEGLANPYEFSYEVCDGRIGDTGAQGVQGPKGDDGKTSIVLSEREDDNNRVKITTGFDTDGDYTTIEEVLSISYVYDGTDGETTTITLEEDGECVIITTYLGEVEIDSETICGCSLDCDGDCDDEEDECEVQNGWVKICHQTSIGQHDYYFPMWVRENSLSGHLNHGDYCGPCNTPE